MLFNSLSFLLFFPAVTLIYYLIPAKYRWIWLLAASYFFYMCWNASYALLIAASTVVTYLSGILIARADRNGDAARAARRKKLWVALSFVINLAILGFFKYFSFAVDNLNAVLGALKLSLVSPAFDVVLPVGISFYTFQALSYTVDVYRGSVKPEKNLFRYALFVSFFPQLVAGPIERTGNLLDQLNHPRKFEYNRMVSGLLVMAWGFFQKMVVADRVAVVVNTVFNDYAQYAGFEIAFAVLLFAVQIYCDFAGYSNIAIGAARVMGVDLMENFQQPYFAGSVKEFWRRWHISLSTWFRDYLYIPLGGSRKGKFRTCLNLMITFLVSGLWHGANWTFVLWGALHGALQIVEGLLKKPREALENAFHIDRTAFSYRFFNGFLTFLLVDFAWIFFRANSLRDAFGIIRNLFSTFNPYVLTNGRLLELGLDRPDLIVGLLAIAVLLIGDLLQTKFKVSRRLMEQNLPFRLTAYTLIVVLLLVFGVYGSGYEASQFIYFQF